MRRNSDGFDISKDYLAGGITINELHIKEDSFGVL
jgi:hypothetical protein